MRLATNQFSCHLTHFFDLGGCQIQNDGCEVFRNFDNVKELECRKSNEFCSITSDETIKIRLSRRCLRNIHIRETCDTSGINVICLEDATMLIYFSTIFEILSEVGRCFGWTELPTFILYLGWIGITSLWNRSVIRIRNVQVERGSEAMNLNFFEKFKHFCELFFFAVHEKIFRKIIIM